MTWFKRKTNEGSNPSQSVKLDSVIEAAKEVIRNTYTPVSMYLPINTKTWSSTSTITASDLIEGSGALDTLRRFLDENGVEWYRDFSRDVVILVLPSGVEVTISGEVFLKFHNQQDIVDYIMNILDQFQE